MTSRSWIARGVAGMHCRGCRPGVACHSHNWCRRRLFLLQGLPQLLGLKAGGVWLQGAGAVMCIWQEPSSNTPNTGSNLLYRVLCPLCSSSQFPTFTEVGQALITSSLSRHLYCYNPCSIARVNQTTSHTWLSSRTSAGENLSHCFADVVFCMAYCTKP